MLRCSTTAGVTRGKHAMRLMAIGLAAIMAGCVSNGHRMPLMAAAGVIDQFEVVSTADAFGGATPSGAAGPYLVITAIVHGKLNPLHPDNAGIVDLANAPVDSDGLVSYTTDVVILRPKVTCDADAGTLAQIHHLAHEACFIANSVKTDVRVEPR